MRFPFFAAFVMFGLILTVKSEILGIGLFLAGNIWLSVDWLVDKMKDRS